MKKINISFLFVKIYSLTMIFDSLLAILLFFFFFKESNSNYIFAPRLKLREYIIKYVVVLIRTLI